MYEIDLVEIYQNDSYRDWLEFQLWDEANGCMLDKWEIEDHQDYIEFAQDLLQILWGIWP